MSEPEIQPEPQILLHLDGESYNLAIVASALGWSYAFANSVDLQNGAKNLSVPVPSALTKAIMEAGDLLQKIVDKHAVEVPDVPEPSAA